MTGRGAKCKTLILCGGKGTRLKELGEQLPKALVPLRGRSVLYHKLNDAICQGYDDFILAVGYKADMIVEACRAMPFDCRYQISDAGVEAGMLQRIAAAREACGERVIVTYGDTLCNLSLDALLDYHTEHQALITIVSAPIQSPFGLITKDPSDRVTSLTEKPILYYYIGTFVMETEVLDGLPPDLIAAPDGRGLIAMLDRIIACDRLYTFVHQGDEITFNTPEELDAAQDGFLKFYTHFR